jgi:6-phosphogluconolactonase (cycloisomerase 2 family)
LKEHAVSEFNAADGTRHIAFHENGKYAYVVHELSNVVSVYLNQLLLHIDHLVSRLKNAHEDVLVFHEVQVDMLCSSINKW